MAKQLDPLKLSERIYKQFARLLDMLEDPQNTQEVTIPQLINALKALQSYDLQAVRSDDDEPAGSTAAAYTKAFTTNAARGRKAPTGTKRAAIRPVRDADDDDAADSA